MTRTAARFRRSIRSEGRWAASTAIALGVLLGLAGSSLPLPAGAADEKAVVGKDELIGKLIPITGDPLERRSVDLRIEFRKNSAEIEEGAMAQLRELGAALVSEALRDVPVGVYGHTDTGGPAQFNLDLSERRSQSPATSTSTSPSPRSASARCGATEKSVRVRIFRPPTPPSAGSRSSPSTSYGRKGRRRWRRSRTRRRRRRPATRTRESSSSERTTRRPPQPKIPPRAPRPTSTMKRRRSPRAESSSSSDRSAAAPESGESPGRLRAG